MPALIREKIQSMTDKTPNLPLNLSGTSDFQPLNSQRPPQKPGRQHVLHSAAQRAPSSPPQHTADPLPTDPPAPPTLPVVVAAVPAADALWFRLGQRCVQPPALHGDSGQHSRQRRLRAPSPAPRAPSPALPSPGPHPSAVTLSHYTEPRRGAASACRRAK